MGHTGLARLCLVHWYHRTRTKPTEDWKPHLFRLEDVTEEISYRDDTDQLKIRHEIYFEKYTPSINEILDIKDELAIKYLVERFKKFLENT